MFGEPKLPWDALLLVRVFADAAQRAGIHLRSQGHVGALQVGVYSP